MPRVKKAPLTKIATKATARPHKKTAKSKQEDASLHQAFVKSLVSLEGYWNKKSASLKKQVDALRAKCDKATQKQKAAKGKSAKGKATSAQTRQLEIAQAQTHALQQELTQARQAWAQAKQAVNKYAALSKMIEQFEREWLKQQGEDVAAPKETKAVKATKKTAKQKATKASDLTSDSKKRGRKPKAKAQPTMPLATLEADDDNEADDLGDDIFDDAFENEVFTSMDELLSEELAEEPSSLTEDDAFED